MGKRTKLYLDLIRYEYNLVILTAVEIRKHSGYPTINQPLQKKEVLCSAVRFFLFVYENGRNYVRLF